MALVVLSVLMSAVALGPGTAAAAGVPAEASAIGSAGTADLAGSGTPGDPYRITSVSGLQSMRDDLDAHYVLAADVDASATSAWNDGAGFDPIGGPNGSFDGTFDGDGHTISGLTIDRPASEEIGLFGHLGEGGAVTDVGLADATVAGGFDVGGLVGLNDGGTVTGSTVTGTVNGTDAVGGLIGMNDGGTVTDATATEDVTGEGQVGGLVGLNIRGTVERATAKGNVTGLFWVGGLVGRNFGTVTDATATGSVTGADSVGGLVGHNSQGTVTASLSRANVSGHSFVGGAVGSNVGGTVERSDARGAVTGSLLVGGLVGWNADGGIVADSTATGSVSGEKRIGGLVGKNENQVTDSYWDTEATGQAASDGGRGLTTAAMTGVAARDNMTGLDVPGTWLLTESYPTLPREGVGPFFTVNATPGGGTVEEGDTVRVAATITNYGRSGTRTVRLHHTGVGDAVRDGVDVELDTGESETVSLSWPTRPGDNGTASLTVASGDDTDPVTVTVAEGSTAGGNSSSGSGDSDDRSGSGDETGSSSSRDDSGGSGGGGGLPGTGSPGEVELTGATLGARTLTAGEEANVAVSLSNFDPAAGRLTLALTADDTTVTERTVSVAASTERTVLLTHRFDSAGTYVLAVNGLSAGTLTVEGRPETTTLDVTATSAPDATGAPAPDATPANGPTATTPPAESDPATRTGTATPTATAHPSSPMAGTPAAGPGFTASFALLALGLVVLLGRRRSN